MNSLLTFEIEGERRVHDVRQMICSIEPWSGARVGKQLRIRRGPLALGRVRDDGIKIWDPIVTS